MVATTPLDARPLAGVSFRHKPLLQTHDLAVGYGGKPPRAIATGLDLSLNPGELVCLIGPNGAGKSTLIRTIAGMQPPLAGTVTLSGENVHKLPANRLAQRLSVVLTERINPGLLTAYTLVELGRHPYTDWSGRLSQQDDAIVRDAIAAVGALPLAQRHVGELSDGERQKIMIARALAQQPDLMILDEPTAFLDLPRRVEIMQLLRRLAHDQQQAILLSTHDLDLALRSADRIWLMSGAGRLHVGAPEDLILSGAFEAAFSAEGVSFDRQTGAFRLSAVNRAAVSVTGEGLPALWTRRALERAGFSVTNGGENLAQVEVASEHWTLTHNRRSEEFATIYDLIEAIRRL